MIIPFISVIVPIYNTERYLTRCLDSILSQSFADFEIICFDDASTDNCYSILQKYKEKDSRIKVYRNKTNQGAGYTKNLAIKKASGNYLCFIDSDDWIFPNTLKTLYAKAIEKNVDDVFYLASNCNEGIEKIIDSERSRYKFIDNQIYNGIDFLDGMLETKIFTVGAVHHFCKRELVLKYASFSEHTINDDLQFTCCLLSNIKRVLFLNKCLYVYYHRRNGSISNKTNTFSFLKECIDLGIEVYSTMANKIIGKKILIFNIAYAMNKALSLSNGLYNNLINYTEQKVKKSNVKACYNSAKKYSIYITIHPVIASSFIGKNIYIYGAGNYAIDCFRVLTSYGVNISGFIVSDYAKNKKEIAGVKIIDIKSFEIPSNCELILGTSEKYYNEILSNLKLKKFKKIILAKELKG